MNLEEKYRKCFGKYLVNIIDFSYYDQLIDNSGLYFGESNNIDKNINSKYFSMITKFFVENMSDEDITLLENDDLGVIERTFRNVIKKKNSTNIMYDPPMPEHYVSNGSLVFEFVYGKNTAKVPDDYYAELITKQKKVINDTCNRLKKEIEDKFGLNCVVFVSKRVKSDE